MKRVIAIVTPVHDIPAAALEPENGAHPIEGSVPPEHRETRIEVVVSDQQADRILVTVLGSESAREEKEPAEVSLEEAILNELRDTGASTGNLLDQIVSRVERHVIEAVYTRCDRNKSRAAMHLGINRNTLLKKLRQFGALTEDEHVDAMQDQL